MRYDYEASVRSEPEYKAWVQRLFQQDVLREIGKFMHEKRGGVAKELKSPTAGAFNVCLQMIFADGSAMIRFPKPANIMFPEEKLRKEVAVMRYIAEKTSIPVPFVLLHGLANESPAKIGPFLMMDYIRHAHDMTDELKMPGFKREERPILNPRVPEAKLRFAYGQMANVLLQLSRPSFAQIGSLVELEDGGWSVKGRPLTFNMNELVSIANFPPKKLPSTAFKTSSSYFAALADTNLIHLSTQRNDAIDSAEDCRRKYVSRQLFRKLILEGRFPSSQKPGPEPFKLFCDDLRPSNVLVDDNCVIVGVIDWEFTYAAPAEFAYSPPWWLLIEMPEKWPTGISDWVKEYEPKLRIFLTVLKEREDAMINDGTLAEHQRLSARMKLSWESGDFWLAYAARSSWAFDEIFWEKIVTNPKYFKKNFGYEDGVKLLSKAERNEMEELVLRKVKESKTRGVRDWDKEGQTTRRTI